MPNFAFSGGIDPVAAYGQRTKIRFVDTWIVGASGTPSDKWTLTFTSTLTGDFLLGAGNLAGQGPTCGLKLRNRMFVGIGDAFLGSSIDSVTKWEEQDSGAIRVSYQSQYGAQDEVMAFAIIQGRLAVFGKKTIQVWQTDADPALFALQQTLDNTGALAAESVKSIGDLDVFYLDPSGVRSLRTKEINLNAYVSDEGTAIDSLIRAALLGYDASLACGIVEPTTRQYWLFLNGTIYVLSKYPESKILAWSTFLATYETNVNPGAANYSGGGTVSYTGLTIGQTYGWVKGANDTSITDGTNTLTENGTFVAAATTATGSGTPSASVTGELYLISSFTPTKMVVHDNQVYILGSDSKVYRYGGSDNNSYDRCQAVVELPWLDMKRPSQNKQGMGLDAAFKGRWKVEVGMNQNATSLATVVQRGSATSPSIPADSTFETGHYPYSSHGTHVKLKATSGQYATAAKLCMLVFQYKLSNMK